MSLLLWCVRVVCVWCVLIGLVLLGCVVFPRFVVIVPLTFRLIFFPLSPCFPPVVVGDRGLLQAPQRACLGC